MKKSAFVLVILLILAAGAQLFTSNSIKSQIDSYIAMLENNQNLSIKSKQIKHNIFGSQIDLKLLANIFDEKIEFDLKMVNSYVLLPQFSKITGDLSTPYAGFKRLFNTQTPIKFKANMGFSKSEIIMNTEPILVDEKIKFSLDTSKASFFLRGDKFKAFELEMPKILIEDEDLRAQLSGVKYYLSYDEPVSLNDIGKKIIDSTVGIRADNIALNSMIFAVKFNELDFDNKIIKNARKYSMQSLSNIKTMDLFKIKLNDMVLDFSFNNFDVNATEHLYKLDEKQLENDAIIAGEFAKIIDNTSNFELKNFGFKANDGQMKLSLKVSLDQNYTQDKFQNITNYLLVDGEFSATKPLSVMFDPLGAGFKDMEQNALNSGMLKASGDGYMATFSMTKDKITINSIEQDTSFLNDEASTNDAQTMEKMYEDLQK